MLKDLQPECEEILNCFAKHPSNPTPICSQIIKEKVVDKMRRQCYDVSTSKDTIWEVFSRFTLSQPSPSGGVGSVDVHPRPGLLFLETIPHRSLPQ